VEFFFVQKQAKKLKSDSDAKNEGKFQSQVSKQVLKAIP
jgi:hypothetical protein